MKTYSKRVKKRNENKFTRNILILFTIFIAVAFYFSDGLLNKFIKILGAEVGVAIFFVVFVLFLAIGRVKPSKKRSEKHTSELHVLKNMYNSESTNRTLVKLDNKKFNWEDKEVERFAHVQEKGYESDDFIPYRSPFDPINQPDEIYEEEPEADDIDNDIEDHLYEKDEYIDIDEETTVKMESDIQLSDLAQVLADDEPVIKPLAKKTVRAIPTKRKRTSKYTIPPKHLLRKNEEGRMQSSMSSAIDYNASKLVKTLESFKIESKIINVSVGPSVTRYELQPKIGVKVSKIVNLSDDIALNLAAKDVRIEAPIPGKAAIGIEVPNKKVVPVYLREVIASKEYRDHSSKVLFALGKDIAGHNIVSDIAKMPHLLIAGATGSGKSVCINTLIISILYKALPSEVRLLMIDPKVVELSIYNGIPHLLIPVVTDPKKASGALHWAVQEMTRRYQLFADNNVRDIRGFNLAMERMEEVDSKLPQIVIIIDELADLMMAAPNEVEDSICRLAQMARAAGMHLVIATQRPSVDVITGVIKANIPSRISFAVSSQVDSRTILDMAGAEKLLGKGDMLFSPMGQSKPIRVQGAFISDEEVEAVVSNIKDKVEPIYDENVLDTINNQVEVSSSAIDDEDELLPLAVELSLERGQASASMFQRKFRIGYARAARILDQMEALGFISGYEGSKPRQVLISQAEWEEINM